MTVQNVPVSTAFPDVVDLFWDGSEWEYNEPNPDGTTTPTPVPPPGPGNTGFLGGFLGDTPLQPSGTLPVQGSIGAITGNGGSWAFSGNAMIGTIGEFTGPIAYTTAPGSTVTANGAYISPGSSVDLTSVTDATFAGNTGTLGINSSKTTFQVEGFVPGDVIDFVGQPNLTLSAEEADTPDTQVNIFNGTAEVQTINFDSSTNISELEPVSDGNGGTDIVYDTSPQLTNFDPVINGSNIDWSFIHTAEAPGGVDVLAPYVPNSGHSGVTIGLGVDLANVGFTPIQFASILGADTNVANDPNLTKLEGAVSSLTRAAAVNYLTHLIHR